MLRGAIFFTASLPAGRAAALHALAVDLVFRLPLGGVYGALAQAFRPAQPTWAALLAVMVVIPALAHLVEFLVHWVGSTARLQEGVLASVAFSAVSAAFNLFLMRNGVLVVGHEGQSLTQDLRMLPRLALEFVLAGPRALGRGLARAWRGLEGGRGRA